MADGLVVGPGKPHVLSVGNESYPGEPLPYHIDTAVGRGVIYHKDFTAYRLQG